MARITVIISYDGLEETQGSFTNSVSAIEFAREEVLDKDLRPYIAFCDVCNGYDWNLDPLDPEQRQVIDDAVTAFAKAKAPARSRAKKIG